jgi:hypothetical protein
MRHTHVKQQTRWASGGLGRFGRKTPDTIAKLPDTASYQKFQPARGFRNRCVRQDAGAQRQFTAMIETMLYDLTTGDEHAEAICRLCDEKLCPQGRCPVTLAVVKCASASALGANDLG